MVILIRLCAFYFGSPRRITYNTFTTLRRFTYLYGITAMYMAHDGVAVETELFLATFVVRMNFRKGVSSPFSQVWKGNSSHFLQTLRFPGSAAFHRRVEDFRSRVAVCAMFRGYAFMHVCGPDFTEALLVAPAPFPAHTVHSSHFTTLYAACAHCLCIAVTIPTTR